MAVGDPAQRAPTTIASYIVDSSQNRSHMSKAKVLSFRPAERSHDESGSYNSSSLAVGIERSDRSDHVAESVALAITALARLKRCKRLDDRSPHRLGACLPDGGRRWT